MKALLIDPSKGTIEDISIESWKDIAPAIDCEIFTVVPSPDERNIIYVDDEGLLKPQEHFVKLAWYPQPLAGRALVLGTDEEGESQDCTLTADDLRGQVQFMTLDEVRAAYA